MTVDITKNMLQKLDPVEATLVRQSLRGNSASQKQLYHKYVRAMYHTVIRMVPNRMDAEDIVQESFVKVFQKLHTFKGDSTLGAWIKRITINNALNHIRKNKRVIMEDLNTQPDVPAPQVEKNSLPLDPKRIHQAIKQLPEGCRVVFNLRLLEGFQHKEIADFMGITESTSKTQYRRAKQLLQKALKEELNY